MRSLALDLVRSNIHPQPPIAASSLLFPLTYFFSSPQVNRAGLAQRRRTRSGGIRLAPVRRLLITFQRTFLLFSFPLFADSFGLQQVDELLLRPHWYRLLVRTLSFPRVNSLNSPFFFSPSSPPRLQRRLDRLLWQADALRLRWPQLRCRRHVLARLRLPRLS